MKDRLYFYYLAVFAVVFAMTPVLNTRTVEVVGVRFLIGVPLTAFAYMCLDVVNNQWGKKEARAIVETMTFVRALLFLALLPVVLALPIYKEKGDISVLMIQSYRNFFAGLIVTGGWQYFVDIPTFAWVKERLQGRVFLARYNALQVVSICMQSSLYVIGCYAFVAGVNLWSLIWGQLAAKVVTSVAMTPIAAVFQRGTKYVMERESGQLG